MSGAKRFQRIILVVLDSVGIGEMPDASEWGDQGSDTLGNILDTQKPSLPNLRSLGLGNIRPLPNLQSVERPIGSFGKAAMRSNGKDTTVGHWEIAGVITHSPFPTYPTGFPARLLVPFQRAIGRMVLGNRPASGTEIIEEHGAEHLRTGKPIIYTSADSVFQIAAHEDIVPLQQLYGFCRIARKLLDGPDRVARVIARPFIGTPGNFIRTDKRRDFAIPPPRHTLLDRLTDEGLAVISVGKIASIFNYRGITHSLDARGNNDAMRQTIMALMLASQGLIFSNFVDFDMLWGHRNDPSGYARGLEEFDQWLPELYEKMNRQDCLILCADHGCDPTTASTDHSREYVPILVYSEDLEGGVSLGVRKSLADIGRTIAENFGLKLRFGASFLNELR